MAISKRLDKQQVETILALAPMQEGLLFHYLSQPNQEHYFEQLSLSLTGNVKSEAICAAWNAVIKTNDMLRTVFRWENLDKPVQIVLKQLEMPLRQIDLSAVAEDDVESRREMILRQDRMERLDLETEPFRVTLCQFPGGQSEMIISNHHILYDGWSNGTILQEFLSAYADIVDGRVPALPTKTSYKAFIKWGQSRDRERQFQFWAEYLAGFAEKTTLPFDGKAAVREQEPGHHRVFFSEAETAMIRSFAQAQGVTLATLLYGAWGVLLQRYSNSQDVVFGTTVSGRPPEVPGIESIVGLFINTIPLRLQVAGDVTVKQVLAEVDRVIKVREEHEDTPLVTIKAASEIDGQENLFDSILVIENYPLDVAVGLAEGALTVRDYRMFEQTSFPLTVNVQTFGCLEVDFLSHAQLFASATVERMGEHFRNVLLGMVGDAHRHLSQIDILTTEEAEQVRRWNDTQMSYPDTKVISTWFEEQVEKTPDRIAALDERGMLTYRALNEKANRLARMLRERGVGRDTIVALMVERSLEMIVGIFAILKAGGAYLPIDPTFPPDRIAYMLEDSAASLLLTVQAHGDKVSFDGVKIDLQAEGFYHPDGSNLPPVHGPRDLAYVIYTSGSTGQPKGTMIEHGALVNRIHWMQRRYPLGMNDVILQKTPYTFDVSVWELLWWSTQGAAICFLPAGGEKDPELIIEMIEQQGVTTIHFVPSMLHVFLEVLAEPSQRSRVASLRQVFASGEALLPHHVEAFEQRLHAEYGTTLHNLYGPTEATIDVSAFDCFENGIDHSVPIGKPIDNIQLYVLDRYDRLQPVGVTGELCIAGIGLARGYLNRVELTAEKFVPHPFVPGERLYRTGDLAKWLPDGNLAYMGRIDHQIKIRGLRIELGEIEEQLVRHGAVKESLVLVKQDAAKQPYLCAYYVAEQEVPVEELRQHLSRSVPAYMVPSRYVRCESFPLTPNGKLDRKKLPEPAEAVSAVSYVSPVKQVEKDLVAIWSKLLQRETIGIHDNFFDIGGNSILLMQMQTQIQRLYPDRVRVTDLFTHVTVHQLASFIETGGSARAEAWKEPFRLPEEFFLAAGSLQEGSALTVEVPLDTTEVLRALASQEQVELYDVLLALYGYLFTELTEQKRLTVQAATLQWNSLAGVAIDLERVQGFSGLFAAVNEMRQGKGEAHVYALTDGRRSASAKQEHAVLPFFFARKSIESGRFLLDVYDIVLEVQEEPGRCLLTCEFDPRRLKKDKIKELLEAYLELLLMLAENFEPQAVEDTADVNESERVDCILMTEVKERFS